MEVHTLVVVVGKFGLMKSIATEPKRTLLNVLALTQQEAGGVNTPIPNGDITTVHILKMFQ